MEEGKAALPSRLQPLAPREDTLLLLEAESLACC